MLIMAALSCATFAAGASDLTLTTTHSGSRQFLAQPGRRAIVQGHARHTLEAWIYPFMILRGYRVSLIGDGGQRTPLSALPMRTVVRPTSIERIYSGQDFTLTEHWFVPRKRAGIILSYSLKGTRKLTLQVAFQPVLNLMWPGAIGGQSSSWDSTLHAFAIHEPTGRYAAYAGSPQATGHSDPHADTRPWQAHRDLSLTIPLAPAGAPANLAITLTLGKTYDGAKEYRHLLRTWPAIEKQDRHADHARLARLATVTTPDAAANRAFRWAEIALEHAWVCNPELGCGLIAGYGPARNARRPQYDWFFGGDGLVAAGGLNAVGDHRRVAAEFAFLKRYQDPRSGMMWHEISQSAGLIDWSRYPFQFRHVDTSMDYLATAADVWKTSGDRQWLRTYWSSLEAAYRYISTLRDTASGLPLIPHGKQGQNEQLVLHDSLSLSLAMLSAEKGYAVLATAMGRNEQARAAVRHARALQKTIGERYWNAKARFVYQGFKTDGTPTSQRKPPIDALDSPAFDRHRQNLLIDRLLRPDFMTAWGIRSLPATDDAYDPSSYASGSVWPVANAAFATALWTHDRDKAAFRIWKALLTETGTDAPGHLDEVFSGNVFRPLNVSVPEQTWSSAGFLTATIRGLLGYRANAVTHTLTLAPHLPDSWKHLSAKRLPFGTATVDLAISHTAQHTTVRLVLDHPQKQAKYSIALPMACHGHQIHATANGRLANTRVHRPGKRSVATTKGIFDEGTSLKLELSCSTR